MKTFVLFFFTLSFFLFICKFTIYLNTETAYSANYYLDFFGCVITLLVYVVGLVSIVTLGDRFWLKNNYVSLLFLYFPLVILYLVSSTTMLQMFLFYELLLLPSLYFVYGTAYTKRSQQANTYFFLWTQIGSIIALVGVAYIFSLVGTTEFSHLSSYRFSTSESFLIYCLFFIGFGVKVPLWPFHYWLTKVHVESPSGFSIFLSGFLVKTAVYCFYRFSTFFFVDSFFFIFPTICLLGVLDGSIKMWGQVDIKKMIAYATVQEMNAIFLLFTLNDSEILTAGYIFLLAHGVLSSLMFYIVELVYRRTHSRSVYKVCGLSELYPNLSISIWTMLILFFGFPGTLKFFAEFYIIFFLADLDVLLTLFIVFIFIFLGTVGFFRNWASLLYGHPRVSYVSMDLTLEEITTVLFLFIFSVLPVFIYIY